jgi:cysteine synthase A
MKIESMERMIGRTPLIEITHMNPGPGRVFAKLEMFNPFSIKDRAALFMINAAEEREILSPGGTIVEPTSGNTGIALAFLAAVRGYKCILTMPANMSPERITLMKAFGAQIILTPIEQGMKGAIDAAREILEKTPNAFMPDQFNNPANVLAHEKSTGPEIWEDMREQIDIFVCGVGTGGTLTGVGHFLSKKNPEIKIIAVEPADSPLLSGGNPAAHKLQGIGANFIPPLLDRRLLDCVAPVTYEHALQTTRKLAQTQGILTGISGGAALWAALRESAKETSEGKNIVTILPDGGERYLSTGLFD